MLHWAILGDYLALILWRKGPLPLVDQWRSLTLLVAHLLLVQYRLWLYCDVAAGEW